MTRPRCIGASAGIVVARAIIRDLFGRERAASVLGLVATVMVAAPTFGPQGLYLEKIEYEARWGLPQ